MSKQNFLSIIMMVMLAGILTSCEKVVSDVVLPDVKPQLAVYGFISPEDTLVLVEVYLSIPIYNASPNNQTPNKVIDATVMLSDQTGNNITLSYNPVYGAYAVSQQTYPINAGYTYTLTVTSKQYRTTATCTVPVYKADFNQLTATVLADQVTSEYSGPYYRYNYKWNDKGGENNYYRITVDENLFGLNYSNVGTLLYDDVNRDGAELSGFIEDYGSGNIGSAIKKRVLVHLLTTDNHYYEYHRRRLEYYGDDPFSEPYPQYSNVKDGLGVFCAFRLMKRELLVQ